MSKYVFVYTQGTATDENRSTMEEWGKFFENLGAAVADIGHPVGAGSSVGAGGKTGPTRTGVTGYSVIEADSLELATKLAADCPMISDGGTVEVFETLAM
jgi:hypothetical protein